jgi:hypothetical protein
MSGWQQFLKFSRFSWALYLANLRLEVLLLVLIPRGLFQALFLSCWRRRPAALNWPVLP